MVAYAVKNQDHIQGFVIVATIIARRRKEQTMSEWIKKDAVLSTIEAMFERCATYDIIDYKELMLEAVKVLPSADRPQGWIPCSERLPEDPGPSSAYASKTYQVTTAGGEVVALKWHKTELRGKPVMRWEWSSGVIYHGDALAWKPLSEPWKRADDESLDVL